VQCGLALGSLIPLPNLVTGTVVLVTYFFAFAGFFAPPSTMLVWYGWLRYPCLLTYPWNLMMHIVYDGGDAQALAALQTFEIDMSVGTCIGVMVGCAVALRLVAFGGLFYRMRRFVF